MYKRQRLKDANIADNSNTILFCEVTVYYVLIFIYFSLSSLVAVLRGVSFLLSQMRSDFEGYGEILTKIEGFVSSDLYKP